MTRYFLRGAAASALALACTALQAGPADYWQWQSIVDPQVLTCSPTPLGPGWKKFRGPFRDSHCEKPAIMTRPVK
ncbi:hypothetical protein [Duganella sp. Leaf126]|uniref:hypothetical protein n=1 Tax=Duganella sp. Leaf126 TaxID=1736266 RepID=UPI0009E7B480|nr:hypothetical protein [Duganella sp. Leaf126]